MHISRTVWQLRVQFTFTSWLTSVTTILVFDICSFSQADYWVYGWTDYDEWTEAEGYDAVDFVYYVFSCYFFPLAIVFMLVFMSHSYKRIASCRTKIYIYTSMSAIFAVAAVFAFIYARNILTCLAYFCVAGTEYDSSADNLQTMMGTIYFFVSIFFSIGFLYLLQLTLNGRDSLSAALMCAPELSSAKLQAVPLPSESDPLISRTSNGLSSTTSYSVSPDMRRPGDVRIVPNRVGMTGQLSTMALASIIATVFLIFYPILIFACMLLPTWWNLFTWTGIQYYQELVPDLSYGYYFSWTSGTVVGKLFPVSFNYSTMNCFLFCNLLFA